MSFRYKTVDIRCETPYRNILIRLGYRSRTSSISEEELRKTKDIIDEAAGYIDLKGAFAICGFTKRENGIILETGESITGYLPSKLCGTADSVLIMAATAGKEIVRKINSLQQSDMTKAVIFDAAASEITDRGLDWIMNYADNLLKRENRRVNSGRFSPGYGDLDISVQKILYAILQLKKLNITLTESCLMIPEKSVTAIAGIR